MFFFTGPYFTPGWDKSRHKNLVWLQKNDRRDPKCIPRRDKGYIRNPPCWQDRF
jgi:hypothetical protein